MTVKNNLALKASAVSLAMIGVMLSLQAFSGEIQTIRTDASSNFGPYVTGSSVRKIYDRPFADVGAISYGEIGWDPVKAIDPGIAVFNNVPAQGATQIIADCVMAPRTSALTGTVDKACNDGFQTHKRYKMSATSFGPIDMVFAVKNVDGAADQDATRNVYRMIGKLNNHTGKRMAGFKVELGHGIGSGFVPATVAENLKIALREEAALVADDLGVNDMAEFPGGLFYGPADTKHSWGFFSSNRAGFTVDQTLLKIPGSVTFTSQILTGDYESLFGKWLPINWVPTGWFKDADGDPGTDAELVAWNNNTNWLTYIIDIATGTRTEEVVSAATLDMYSKTPSTVWTDDGNMATLGGTLYATWDAAQSLYVLASGGTLSNDDMTAALAVSATLERRVGYVKGPVEDLANLNLNYFIEVGDVSSWANYNAGTAEAEFTLRITPIEALGDSGIAPSWAPIDTASSTTSGGGGGCTTAVGNAPFDPMLPMLAALGLVGLGVRRLRRH